MREGFGHELVANNEIQRLSGIPAGQEQLRIELDVAHQAEAAALRMELEGAQRARDAVMQERDDLVAINIQSREIIGAVEAERNTLRGELQAVSMFHARVQEAAALHQAEEAAAVHHAQEAAAVQQAHEVAAAHQAHEAAAAQRAHEAGAVQRAHEAAVQQAHEAGLQQAHEAGAAQLAHEAAAQQAHEAAAVQQAHEAGVQQAHEALAAQLAQAAAQQAQQAAAAQYAHVTAVQHAHGAGVQQANDTAALQEQEQVTAHKWALMAAARQQYEGAPPGAPPHHQDNTLHRLPVTHQEAQLAHQEAALAHQEARQGSPTRRPMGANMAAPGAAHRVHPTGGLHMFPGSSEKAKNAAGRLKELEDRGRAVLQSYRN